MLELKNVCRFYDTGGQRHQVIEHMNLTVKDRDFFVIAGPSGCGKSTLLRVIGGFDRPDEGEILLDGRKVTKPSREIMMVFQSFDQLFPWLTLIGNLTYAMKKSGTPMSVKERQDRAAGFLAIAGLSGFENRYPHQLSGGMKQRGALARALCLTPKILLMDEPFSSLDLPTRKGLYPCVKDMAAQTGCSIVLVTHDIREALTLGDTIAVMSGQKKGIAAVYPRGAHPTEAELESVLEETAGLSPSAPGTQGSPHTPDFL